MIITVKILQGRECSIEVSASSSISAVKQLVAQELEIPVDQQRLVFKGKTLSDGLCLCDYDIVDGNRLHLFVRQSEDSQPQSSQVLWEHMHKFLRRHFSPSDAAKVLEEFKKDLNATTAALSLDDIERLALLHMGETLPEKKTK